VNASSLLLIDLGGGSCELTLSEHGHIAHMVSLPLGAVRLTQEFLEHDPPKQREITRMCEFIAEEISRAEHRFRESPIQLTIGTSGTAAALHDLWVARHKPQARTVPATGVAQLAENLASMDLRKRRALPGIGPKRAEIIIAGATVFAELLTRLKLSSLRYSPLGLRDGLLAQMAADYGRSEHLRKHIATERTDAVLQMCRHYGVDLKHANRVREMAESLFASLKTVHQLPPEYVDWLSAAAMLYEVGSYVNRSGRHRHAHYIIAHSEIFGYTLAQRRVVAAIARYLGKSRPHPDDPPLRLVPSAERAYIPTAVALLRIAAALDQGRRGNVRSVSARRTGKTVRLELETRRPAELEHWAINKECAYFRAVFGLELIAES
jgi:exopolyphosphatase/guanosine-5'-triphosphate,3'-diphosphate pyrophosphatase